NVAHATDGTTNSATDSVTVTATQSPALTIDRSEERRVGKDGSYPSESSHLVKNSCNVTLYTLSVVDDHMASQTCPDTSVGRAPGASLTSACAFLVSQADRRVRSLTNVAHATDGTTNSATDSVTVTATQSPALTID